jgi:hypothetical protein
MKRSLFTATVLLALAIPFGGIASAASTAPTMPPATPALKIKIEPRHGLKKIKVGRTIDVLASCSTKCRVNATVVVTSGGDSLKYIFKRVLPPNEPFNPGVHLHKDSLAFLKANIHNSKFKIHVSAVDVKTGKKAGKTRTYRFKR